MGPIFSIFASEINFLFVFILLARHYSVHAFNFFSSDLSQNRPINFRKATIITGGRKFNFSVYITKDGLELTPYELYLKQRAELEKNAGQTNVNDINLQEKIESVINTVADIADPIDKIDTEDVVSSESLNNKSDIESAASAIEVDNKSIEDSVVNAEDSEVTLSQSMDAEIRKLSLRSDRIANFSSTLQKSMLKKVEVENFIAAELDAVTEKLSEELGAEIEWKNDLERILSQFSLELQRKQETIEKERILLGQMVDVMDKVKEASIRMQFQNAMSKKEELIDIEIELRDDMLECERQLKLELETTLKGIEKIDAILAVLPKSVDKSRARAYGWEDIEVLQEILISNAQSMAESCGKVASLRERFNDAVLRKKKVLNEEDEPVKEGFFQAAKNAIDDDLTVNQLTDAAKRAGLDTVKAIGKTLKIGSESFREYLRSPKAQSAASSTIDLVEATSSYFKAMKRSFDAAMNSFNQNKIPESEITSFDKMYQRTILGMQSIQSSVEVQDALKDANQWSNEVKTNAIELGKLTTESIQDAASNKELSGALSEVLVNIQNAFAALVGLGSKAIRTVPPAGRLLSAAPDADIVAESSD